MDGMSLEQFREAKKSGIDLYAEPEVKVDAAPIQDEPNETSIQDDMDAQEHTEDRETDDNADLSGDTEEPIEIPEAQKTAFQKALDREKRKAREAADKKFKEQYESEYSEKLNPYKQFFDSLGLDPQKAMELIETNRMKQEAETLAYQHGWSEEQTQMFMKQQQLEKEQTDMKVSLKLYELSETPDYPGIKQMKGAITEFVRLNPRTSVEQAYWAVGGANLAQQLKREAEQREIAKRSQPKRTVVTDAPSNNKGPAPLPPEAVAFMRQNSMTEAQVRQLLQDDFPKDLESFRKMKQGRK